MKILYHTNEIEVRDIYDFDLNKTLECGQCFRWNYGEDGVYTGVAFYRVLRLRQEGHSIFFKCSKDDFDKIWYEYFDLGRDYSEINKQLRVDDFMRSAIDYGAGIRILKQDAWEVLISFIISQNNHIPRIKKIISTLCESFGDKIKFDGEEYFSFPTVKKLVGLNENDLTPLSCGYRSAYIIAASKAVDSGELDLARLSKSSEDFAHTQLKKQHGIGNKVADCILLYGLHKLNAFPVDVWIKRAVALYYNDDFDSKIFSPYAGIAQQYMFYYLRSVSKAQKIIFFMKSF